MASIKLDLMLVCMLVLVVTAGCDTPTGGGGYYPTTPTDTVQGDGLGGDDAGGGDVTPGSDTDGGGTCTPSCLGKTCGDDGCGGSCGECTGETFCDEGLCAALKAFGEACTDNGDCQAAFCAQTTAGKTCSKECADTSECPEGWTCVSVTLDDVELVVCMPPVCQPVCGTNDCGPDGCGGSCGECADGYQCAEGSCIPDGCTADCTDKVCGDDGCGGSCGTCEGDDVCVGGACVATCEPATCSSLGYQCGAADDGCGISLDCGTCDAPAQCVDHECMVTGSGGLGSPCVYDDETSPTFCGTYCTTGSFWVDRVTLTTAYCTRPCSTTEHCADSGGVDMFCNHALSGDVSFGGIPVCTYTDGAAGSLAIGQTCDYDASCEAGICMTYDESTPSKCLESCLAHDDCPTGQVCAVAVSNDQLMGACHDPEDLLLIGASAVQGEPCPDGTECYGFCGDDSTCLDLCRTSSDCPTGYRCSWAVTNSTDGTTFTDALALCMVSDLTLGTELGGSPCSSGSECRSGECGDDGFCIDKCTDDSQCAPGTSCIATIIQFTDNTSVNYLHFDTVCVP